jgi:hypothetical protein
VFDESGYPCFYYANTKGVRLSHGGKFIAKNIMPCFILEHFLVLSVCIFGIVAKIRHCARGPWAIGAIGETAWSQLGQELRFFSKMPKIEKSFREAIFSIHSTTITSSNLGRRSRQMSKKN